jgi:micrococcal nuclease
MSFKKIGLLAAAAVIVVAAAVGSGADQDVAVVSGATPSQTATATASVSVSPSPATASTPSPTTAPSPTPKPTPAPLAGTVIEVVDGDTVRVELSTGIETVRIIGIDTPEVVHPSKPEGCFGAEASAFAKATLDGQAVTLELDPTQDKRDRFDRLLAHVRVGDALYASEAIAGGYGIHYVYDRPSIHASELDAAETEAREANLGIWASCEGRVDLPIVAEPVDAPGTIDDTDADPPAGSDCHPSYHPCVPDVGHDLDCGDIGFPVAIVGPDEYRLDGSDHDERGCESFR